MKCYHKKNQNCKHGNSKIFISMACFCWKMIPAKIWALKTKCRRILLFFKPLTLLRLWFHCFVVKMWNLAYTLRKFIYTLHNHTRSNNYIVIYTPTLYSSISLHCVKWLFFFLLNRLVANSWNEYWGDEGKSWSVTTFKNCTYIFCESRDALNTYMYEATLFLTKKSDLDNCLH